MLATPDSCMIEDLTVDELRWLEASEIIDFPTSTTPSASSTSTRDAFSSKRSTLAHSGPPTPPRAPANRSIASQPPLQGSSPSEWLYRRPKNPIASRLGPSTSALSSTIPLSQPAPVREAPPLLIRTPSASSAKAARAKADAGNDEFDESATNGDAKISRSAPFWSSMLRPRSRSVRSIPGLKTIPSQSQADLLHSPAPSFSLHPRNDIMEDIPESIILSRRSPSISSTSSSTLSSAASSSHPDTPVSAHPDPFGAFVTKPHKGYHRRHISAPTPPRDYRLAPLSTSCPSKSILTRSSSISTKDSAITPSNKSVKFVEIPTVHYSNSGAGFWGDTGGADRRSPADGDMGMGVDVDDMDVDEIATSRIGGGAWNVNRLGFAGPQWSNSTEFDMDVDPPPRVPQEGKNGSSGLKRLMSLSRRSSVTTSASSNRRKSSASTSSTVTITPSKPLPSPPSQQPPPTPPKPAISGPYALGSVQAASPTHSTASLRSTSRHKPKAKSMSYASTPVSGNSSMHDHHLEDYRSTKNAAARSVRSIASIKSDASTSTTKRFRSFLLTKVSVGGAWSKN